MNTGNTLNIMSDKSAEDKSAPKSRSWLERLTNMLAREPKNRDELMEILRVIKHLRTLSQPPY